MALRLARSIRESLGRTRNVVFSRIAGVLGTNELTEATWDDLEELLIQADLGVATTMYIVDRLRRRAQDEAVLQKGVFWSLLAEELRALLPDAPPLNLGNQPFDVVLVAGVNGSGKTTSIAKLAHLYKQQGCRVLLAAADTFRAAAIDQLDHWAKRIDVVIVKGPEGGDPGSVVFDAMQAARARKVDVVIIDTAGRLHTQHNLMAELEKVRRVAAKGAVGAPHEVFLVLDASTGQNGLVQARQFQKIIDVTGVILAKLDGTSRGGIIFPIARELKLPVRFVGTGEGLEDLVRFDAGEFVDGLLVR